MIERRVTLTLVIGLDDNLSDIGEGLQRKMAVYEAVKLLPGDAPSMKPMWIDVTLNADMDDGRIGTLVTFRWQMVLACRFDEVKAPLVGILRKDG